MSLEREDSVQGIISLASEVSLGSPLSLERKCTEREGALFFLSVTLDPRRSVVLWSNLHYAFLLKSYAVVWWGQMRVLYSQLFVHVPGARWGFPRLHDTDASNEGGQYWRTGYRHGQKRDMCNDQYGLETHYNSLLKTTTCWQQCSTHAASWKPLLQLMLSLVCGWCGNRVARSGPGVCPASVGQSHGQRGLEMTQKLVSPD